MKICNHPRVMIILIFSLSHVCKVKSFGFLKFIVFLVMYSSTFYPIEAVGESRCEGLFRRNVWDTECEAMRLSKTFKTKM